MIGHVILIRPTALRFTMAAIMVVSSTISIYVNKENNDDHNATGKLIYITADNDNNDTAVVVVREHNGSIVTLQRGLSSELVQYGVALGDPCSDHCSDNLTHVICNATTSKCECEIMYPIQLDDFICISALHLGDICIHEESCLFHDPNAECWQESPYYSKCACKSTYMSIEIRDTVTGHAEGGQKCVPDPYTQIHYDMPAILGIGVGLSLFTGVTCLVLKLFSRARFSDTGGHYADANQSPPMLMTPVSGPPSRRSSERSSGSRKQSYYTTLAPLSRPGSRRPSMVSLRSQTSIRSYGGRYDRGHHHVRHGHGQGHHHEPLRATTSAPISGGNGGIEELGSPSSSSISSMRMLEQRFAQHASYHPRREDRETSRHSSQEIITDVISESPEKSYK